MTGRWGIVESGRGPDGQTTFGSKTRTTLLLCYGRTVSAMGIRKERIQITVEADLDLRGTLGIAKDVPVGFEEIRMRF